MYFDHVKCPNCDATFEPEMLSSLGNTLACPRCGGGLSLRSLFGIAAAFSEEDAPEMGIDDLVPNPTKKKEPKAGSALAALRDLKKK